MASSVESLYALGYPKPAKTEEDPTVDNATLKDATTGLLRLLERTGYQLIQINGQRLYGGPPPNWKGPQPPRGSEIFVGKIPRNCFEDEIVPVFEKIGQIYEMRLMMDFSGSNRGFGFVMYLSPEIATLAINTLNNYEIREGRRIGVVRSANNCRLSIGNIPSDKNEEDIKSALGSITEGVMKVWFPKKSRSSTKHCFLNSSVQNAVVEYDSHRSAALARRRLIPNKVVLWGKEITVDWATPQRFRQASNKDYSEAKVNQEHIQTSPAITQYSGNNIQCYSNSNTGTLSSCNSNTWSLEQMIDHLIYGNSSTDSALLHMKDPLQPLIAGLPNVTNISAGATSAILKPRGITSVTFSAVDANGAAGEPGTEAVSGFETGGTIMSGMRNFGVEMGRNPRAYHLYQGNCHNGDSFGPGQKFDCSAGLLKPQISNYSDGDYRPQMQRYLHGANLTPIFVLGDVRSNEHVEGTQLSLQGRAAQSELFYDQTLGAFNRLKVGRPIRGSALGLDSIPATGSIRAELALPRNQNFVAQKFLQESKCDENLSPVSCIGGMNMRAGEDRALSFGHCMPNIKCHGASGNVAANMCNATSWKGKWNVRKESSPALDSHITVLMNCKKTDVPVSSFGGKQEVLPKSHVSSTLRAPIARSGVFKRNAATGIQYHTSNFNKAPGSAVDLAGRYCYVNQPSKML